MLVLLGDPARLLRQIFHFALDWKIRGVLEIGAHAVADAEVRSVQARVLWSRGDRQQLETDRTIIVAAIDLESHSASKSIQHVANANLVVYEKVILVKLAQRADLDSIREAPIVVLEFGIGHLATVSELPS